jgi:hypothetical protein
MIRIPNLHTVNTAIEADSAALEAVLRTGAPPIENAPATPELVEKRGFEIDAVSRHSRLVLEATARRQRYRAQSSLDQVSVLLQDARERESALAAELESTPSGSLIGGALLIVAAGFLLVVEYFLVVSVVPPALGLRPGSLSAMAMAAVTPLAMVALEPFVDQVLVTPFMRRRAFSRRARAFLAVIIVLVGAAMVVIAIRVVTVNAELRQQYSQVLSDLLKHKQSELSPATVRASVLAIGVLALIAAPFLCSFGYQSMTGGYQRWKLRRQQHDMRQLALAANLRIADGRSHIAMLEEGDAARAEADSVE